MTVTPKKVTRYYAERVLYRREQSNDSDSYTQRKSFSSKARAYRWVARAEIFRKRDENGCPSEPHPEDGACLCRYCDESKWRPMVERLARLRMRHDDKERKAKNA